MRKLSLHIINILTLSVLVSCHPIEEFEQNNKGNFDALWTEIDEHYCFFADKDVDWDEVYRKYSPMVNESLSRTQLFGICESMLNELQDGHTNLSTGFETSYYRKWWTDYPQNFNRRIIEENYLKFRYKQLGTVIYSILPENIGYIMIPSFSGGLSNSNIDWILSDLLTTNGLIIDVRDNGGGQMNYAENWVKHFMTEPLTAGYMVHKNGPGHDDFDSPYPIEFNTLGAEHIVWIKPVVVLTNRSTYSAANYFVMCMKELGQVTHAGAKTGGGAGMPYSGELPNGWGVRMSAVKVLTSNGENTEFGISPDEDCEIDMNAQDEAEGRDSMLDFAITLLQ